MADPRLVLLVVLAGPPGSEPIHGAVVGSAVRDTLGDATRVLVDDRRAPLSDDEVISTATRIHADAVASMAWTAADATRARVRMFVTVDGLFHDHELTFRPADAIVERERAMGLLIGAMAREDASPNPRRADDRGASVASDTGGRDVARVPVVVSQRSLATERAFAIEGGAMGTLGLGGAALAVGPHIGGAWYPTTWLGLRAGGALAIGAIPDAGATTMSSRIIAGLAWRAATFGPGARGSFELGASAVVMNHRVSRDEPLATRSRWISGAHIGARLGWSFTPTLEPFLAVTGELVAGNTPIVVDRRTIAQVPPIRLLGELGVALRF